MVRLPGKSSGKTTAFIADSWDNGVLWALPSYTVKVLPESNSSLK
ncbi:hypothetical protein [Levilactobacillus parabrevis]